MRCNIISRATRQNEPAISCRPWHPSMQAALPRSLRDRLQCRGPRSECGERPPHRRPHVFGPFLQISKRVSWRVGGARARRLQIYSSKCSKCKNPQIRGSSQAVNRTKAMGQSHKVPSNSISRFELLFSVIAVLYEMKVDRFSCVSQLGTAASASSIFAELANLQNAFQNG